MKDNSGQNKAGVVCYENINSDFIWDSENGLLVVHEKFREEVPEELLWGVLAAIPGEKGFEVTVSQMQEVSEVGSIETQKMKQQADIIKTCPWEVWDEIGLSPNQVRALEDYHFEKSFQVGSQAYYLVSLPGKPDIYAMVDQFGITHTDFEITSCHDFSENESGLYFYALTQDGSAKIYYFPKKGDLQCIYRITEGRFTLSVSSKNAYLICTGKKAKLLKFEGAKVTELDLAGLDAERLTTIGGFIVYHGENQVTVYEIADDQLVETFRLPNWVKVDCIVQTQNGSTFFRGYTRGEWKTLEINQAGESIEHLKTSSLGPERDIFLCGAKLYSVQNHQLFVFEEERFKLVAENFYSHQFFHDRLFVAYIIDYDLSRVYEIRDGKENLVLQTTKNYLFFYDAQRDCQRA
ncbi:MAG: hypothetical protein HQM15_09560 [Deltaproteobacteria bacterium]|nr:hypothetical protein [Deltaproteobacteria bacterium]